MVLQIITLVILGYFIKSYFPAYFQKKGENLATKEDIGEITQKIEQVKVRYSAQLEDIRLSVKSIYDRRKSFSNRQQFEVLRFYDLATEFYYEKLAVNFGDFPMDNGKSLFLYQESFNKNVLNLVKSYQRIVVFFENENKLRIFAEQVLVQALEARKILKKHFGKVKITSVEEGAAHKSGDRSWVNDAVEAANEANKVFWRAMKPLLESYRNSLRFFLTELNLYLRPAENTKIPETIFKE
jgi:hypothetical protein